MKNSYEDLIHKIVKNADLETEYIVIRYGISQGIIIIGFTFISMIISAVFGNGFEGLLFLLFFYFLRTYAGGYHAETRKKCWCISIGIIVIANLFLKLKETNYIVENLLLILAGLHLIMVAPIENKNKPLSAKQKVLYRRRVRLILGIYFVGFVFADLLDLISIKRIVWVSVIFSEALVFMGILKLSSIEGRRFRWTRLKSEGNWKI